MHSLRWLAFAIYQQNPFIRPPKAQTAQSYISFPWEALSPSEAEEKAKNCHVTQAEAAELDRIFAEINKKQQ